jgi:ADP-ribosylglycohydrolase
MPRIMKIEITDETLAHVREYCRITGAKVSAIMSAADYAATVNDLIRQVCDLRYDCESKVYCSRCAAASAAAKYWSHNCKEWDRALQMKYSEGGEERKESFESPLPMPENWLRMKGGGYMHFDDDCSQEEINRLVGKGIL